MQQPAGFEERTLSHHEETLRPVLQADQVFILTHATRGDIRAYILQPLTQKVVTRRCSTWCQWVCIEQVCQTNPIAALLTPFKTELKVLKSALSKGRMLVAGIFAYRIFGFGRGSCKMGNLVFMQHCPRRRRSVVRRPLQRVTQHCPRRRRSVVRRPLQRDTQHCPRGNFRTTLLLRGSAA